MNISLKSGYSTFIYILILAVITLFFFGMNSCARENFQSAMKELSDSFVSRQRSDQEVAERLHQDRPRHDESWSISGGPVRPAVSRETERRIREHTYAPESQDDRAVQ